VLGTPTQIFSDLVCLLWRVKCYWQLLDAVLIFYNQRAEEISCVSFVMCLNEGHDHYIPKLLPSCMVTHNNTGLVMLWEYDCLKARIASYVSSRFSSVGHILCSSLMRNQKITIPVNPNTETKARYAERNISQACFCVYIFSLFMLKLRYSVTA